MDLSSTHHADESLQADDMDSYIVTTSRNTRLKSGNNTISCAMSIKTSPHPCYKVEFSVERGPKKATLLKSTYGSDVTTSSLAAINPVIWREVLAMQSLFVKANSGTLYSRISKNTPSD
ncbi:hypothetical protein KIN20_018314 [Parelaphostrongylus tenuis]|uniref:Uncharacterized protein n=1 Tax=Parelaphostrongylus tenuis TaxID=148309 RepID=A0AAD5N3I1_PARTN|nr:hypothetical protein KIN20_018314 [Parelaphostrongylus tenuis]